MDISIYSAFPPRTDADAALACDRALGFDPAGNLLRINEAR
jgi:hypothetical protein